MGIGNNEAEGKFSQVYRPIFPSKIIKPVREYSKEYFTLYSTAKP